MGTNSRMAARGRVKKDLEESYGAAVGVGYDIAMSFLDAAYGAAVVGGGKIADGMEAASSAVNTYISLINSGVSPEIAGVQAGLQVGLDLVDLTGVGDEESRTGWSASACGETRLGGRRNAGGGGGTHRLGIAGIRNGQL